MILHLLIGCHFKATQLIVRFVAGAWTLAALIFVLCYTSTLITYVMAPIHQSLINSVYDIVESTDVNLLIRKGGTLDYLFTVSFVKTPLNMIPIYTIKVIIRLQINSFNSF